MVPVAGALMMLGAMQPGAAQTVQRESAMQMVFPGFGPAALPSSGSTTQLYGTVDNFIDYYKSGDTHGTRLQSGGAWTSKFGFFSREDLGGGLSAETQLEAGFNSDTGTSNGTVAGSLFTRMATVALKSKTWGNVTLGRQFGMGTDTFIDPFLAVSKLSVYSYLTGPVSAPGATVLPDRVDKAVTYATPSLAGFTLQGQLAFSGDATKRTVKAGGVRLGYYGKGLYLAASYVPIWSDPVATGGGTAQVRNDLYSVAAEYDTLNYTVSGAYQQYNVQTPGAPVVRMYVAGAMVPVRRDLIRMSVVYRDEAGTNNDAWGLMVGYDYTLSKRTFLYARAGLILNKAHARYTVDLIPVGSPGETPMAFALGMAHHF
jgi:predicted porin